MKQLIFFDIPSNIKNLRKRCTTRFLNELFIVYHTHTALHGGGKNIIDYIKPYINYREPDKIIMTRIYNIEDGNR